jgi:coenzyme F420-reducing hydrogenase delta subunit
MKNPSINLSLFYCSNSISAEEIQFCTTKIDDVQLKTVSLPCSGKANLLYLLKSIETGSDGVLVMTCKMGECKYLQGNMRAEKRIEAVDDLLVESGMPRGCIKCVHLEEGNKIDIIVKEINTFVQHLKTQPELTRLEKFKI